MLKRNYLFIQICHVRVCQEFVPDFQLNEVFGEVRTLLEVWYPMEKPFQYGIDNLRYNAHS